MGATNAPLHKSLDSNLQSFPEVASDFEWFGFLKTEEIQKLNTDMETLS